VGEGIDTRPWIDYGPPTMRLALPALLTGLALTASACGRGSEAATDAPPPQVSTAAEVAPASPPPDVQENRASGLRLGIAFSANLLGELEPCG